MFLAHNSAVAAKQGRCYPPKLPSRKSWLVSSLNLSISAWKKIGNFPGRTITELEEEDKADDVFQLKAQSTHLDVKACRVRGSWQTVTSKEVEWGYMAHANKSVSCVRQMSPSHTPLHLSIPNLPLSV
jgi:hypothetical protein